MNCRNSMFMMINCLQLIEIIDFWSLLTISCFLKILKFIDFSPSDFYYTIIDLCWGRHGVLLNSKRHIDRRGAEVNMIKSTVQLHYMSTET